MENRKLLTGLILFLAITNLVTILTVVVHVKKSSKGGEEAEKATAIELAEPVYEGQRTRFFARELSLDSGQQEEFREIHQVYMRKARMLSAEMSQLRDDLLEAMDQDEPDAVRMDEISEQIGLRHTELKKLTVQYYIGLKSICNPDQQKKLYTIIKGIIKPDGDVQLPREGGRRGGAGNGRGPWWRNQKDSTSD